MSSGKYYYSGRRNNLSDYHAVVLLVPLDKLPHCLGLEQGVSRRPWIVGTSRHALPSSGAHISPVSRASPAPSLTSRATSPAPSLTNITGRSLNDTSVWTARASPNASFDMTHGSALAASYANSMKNFSHPQPTLKSYEDFENSGIFEVQPLLEQRHKEEEERLQRFLAEEREKEFKRLNDTIASEKEKAAEDLLSSILFAIQPGPDVAAEHGARSLVEERERIEEHFQRVQEDRLKLVREKISTEEKTRSGKMLDRHCQEMLMLIGEKASSPPLAADREMDRTNLFDHSMRPPIETPESKKVHLYKTPAVFENIDLRAIALVNKDYENYTDLVKDLTRDCHSELEKVRAIFRWVIAKDLSKNQVSEIVRPQQTNALLKGVKSGKETYHQLFKKLCSYAGIHCEIILGYSKGAGYKPGMRMDGNAFRNSWTAVHVEGSWRLINCTWAARHVTGHRDNLPQLFHKYDEFYFLTDPEDYVYQHYPDEPSWQLLEIPLPFSEFLNLPVVKSPFFNYGLRFYSNYGATLTTETGMVEIRLVTPKILGFGSLLEPVNKSASDPRQYDGRVLLRYVKNEAIFTVALPNPGLFYFTVYVGDYWNSECLESACTFLINCPAMSGRPSPPYPPVPFFGPTPVMDTWLLKDLKISHTFQYFDVHDGSISDIDRFVFLRSRNEKGANYLVRCPKEGFYIFSLFAADTTSAGEAANNLDCAMRYLIICQEPSPSVGEFPRRAPAGSAAPCTSP
ncbi:hypothetical protein C0Q70_08249 [Pomacea canaliculata]|uniref:Transglutaminase-like domain-containing protein n=1 Tax=Pomacea canaliculata TaxID=400727 RepID=A0A2T7PHA1_POMCA|nr:hypothetical protein C0Q70_08249 [Pomacea canaliculata]